MLLLIIYILLWVLLYYLEGSHDAFFTKETNEHPPAKDKAKANYYKGRWHVYDSYSYAIFHIGFAILFSLVSVTEPLEAISEICYLKSVTLLLIGIAIRMIAHDMFFDIGMKRKVFIIPTCQGTWDFWDCWLVKLNKIHPLLPYVLRFTPITISIIFYSLFFLNGC